MCANFYSTPDLAILYLYQSIGQVLQMESRLEKYRQIRKIKRMYAISVILFLGLLLSGVLAADTSINRLIKNEKGIGIISVNPVEKDQGLRYEIRIMNRSITLDLTYISRDIQRIRQHFGKAVG